MDGKSDANSDVRDSSPTHDLDNGATAAPSPLACRVQTSDSPYLNVFSSHHVIQITLDSGATGDMIHQSTAVHLRARVVSSAQSAHQANGYSHLQAGETRITFTSDDKVFQFTCLVVGNPNVEVLAGTPFMETNDVAVHPAKKEVSLGDSTVYKYGLLTLVVFSATARHASILRAPTPSKTCSQTLSTPSSHAPMQLWLDDSSYPSCGRSREIVSVAGKIRIPNLSTESHRLKLHEHFCQVTPRYELKEVPSPHHVNTLASCPAPDTVGQMRLFVGAHKVLSCVLLQCSAYLAPLEVATVGRQFPEAIAWTDELRLSFHGVQQALSYARVITLPRPLDQLWIVMDGAVRQPGIGATLYLSRGVSYAWQASSVPSSRGSR